MPVSTDGVILGAWAALTCANTIMDIGAGSGLLSLMAAQRSSGQVIAVEIDAQASKVCRQNVERSPWPDRVQVIEQDIRQLACLPQWQAAMDYIICNPPYFDNGPQSLKQGRSQARHTDSLSFSELLTAMAALLKPDAGASIILPQASHTRFMSALSESPLNLACLQPVQSVATKQANRYLLQLAFATGDCRELPPLLVRDQNNAYTPAMRALTGDFYL
nr:methyltransferase [Shewanella sp. NIFS-20-20]